MSHSQRTGTEPTTARSALGLRAVLAAAGLVLFTAATVSFSLWAASSSPYGSPDTGELEVLAGICGVLTLISAVNLAAVLRRRAKERP
ncbi:MULTISPECIES: DUF6343 family protein [Streptomyces]|uniref:DUF6343 family protein n=1 Tax=Streptomyces TaxID=1883 RepID=UPI001F216C22|nr:DUF6343 family protein [Streptomyces olivochromogenes]